MMAFEVLAMGHAAKCGTKGGRKGGKGSKGGKGK